MDFQPFYSPNTFTLEELQNRLSNLKKQKFLLIFGKKRNSAIGESLEIYLGLVTNRSRSSDWGEYELKTITEGSHNKVSLFNVRWKYHNNYNAKKLICEYGKPHHSKHLGVPVIRLDWEIFHSVRPLNKLYIKFPLEDESLTLNYGKKIIATINRKNLKKWFGDKFKNLVLVRVKPLKKNNRYGFIIKTAILLEKTSFQNFIKLIRSNQIILTFRLMLIQPNTPNEQFNNRGSGFRATESILLKLYESQKRIL